MDFVKEPHTAIFSGPTSCGKTQLVLDLIENEYRAHFDNIVILCPTLRWNKTYLGRSWVWKDDYVFCIEPNKGSLIQYIDALSRLLSGENTLFIIDDCITDDELNKTRGALLTLAISGRHREHTLWMLTQRYTKIPLTVRDQAKQLFVWYPKNRKEFETIHDENYIVESKEEIARIKRELQNSSHSALYLRMEHPRGYHII